jgi:hypothetical protein
VVDRATVEQAGKREQAGQACGRACGSTSARACVRTRFSTLITFFDENIQVDADQILLIGVYRLNIQ